MITNVIFVDRLIVDFSGQNKLLTYDTLGLDHIIICWGKLAIGVFKGEKGVVFIKNIPLKTISLNWRGKAMLEK